MQPVTTRSCSSIDCSASAILLVNWHHNWSVSGTVINTKLFSWQLFVSKRMFLVFWNSEMDFYQQKPSQQYWSTFADRFSAQIGWFRVRSWFLWLLFWGFWTVFFMLYVFLTLKWVNKTCFLRWNRSRYLPTPQTTINWLVKWIFCENWSGWTSGLEPKIVIGCFSHSIRHQPR